MLRYRSRPQRPLRKGPQRKTEPSHTEFAEVTEKGEKF
jgi:hypothetical protein